MIIKLRDDIAEIVEERDTGVVVKSVSPQSLCEAFASNAKFNTGILPPNTRHYSRRDDIEFIAFEMEPSIRV
jgi:hypothetical protein